MTTDSERRFSFKLDLIRGLAALAVLISHARGMFLVDYNEAANSNLPFIRLLYLATGFGHQAVIIFFVLSGFFISSSILRSWPRWSWTHYLSDRFVRLYLVLIPGLLLTFMADRIGRSWGDPGIYEGQLPGNLISYHAADRLDAYTFLINLFFLQTVLAPPFGSNSPLWSLCNEFWYYMAFPCLLTAIHSNRTWGQRTFCLSVAIGIAFMVGSQVSLYFLIWLMGAFVRLCPPIFRAESRVVIRRILEGAVASATILLLLGSRIWVSFPGWDFIIGGVFATWMYLRLHDTAKEKNELFKRLARFFAGCSFTLYVIHFPLLVLIYSFIVGSGRWQPGFISSVLLVSIISGVFLFAFGLARITEANTSTVRRWLFLLRSTRTDVSSCIQKT